MQPIVGSSRTQQCIRTLSVFEKQIRKLSRLSGKRLLDVGCGEGTFTKALSIDFEEVYAIDIQESNLLKFRESASDKFTILNMSATDLDFADDYFDTLLTIETIEHIDDLEKAAKEFHRVIRLGGELIITCPNRLFPFENHGIKVNEHIIYGRVPLITWVPFLHDRFSLARVFTVKSLDKLFPGFMRVGLAYAYPTFEHGGNIFQPLLKPLAPLMRTLEQSPLKIFGTSIIVRYIKKS